MQKQKLVVVKQILCRCISLNTTRIEDITEIAVIMFDFSKHLRDIFQGATWDVSAANLWQNCLWRFYLSCHGEHFLEAHDLGELLISFSAHMFLKDWSCAPWTVVGLIFGAMLFGVPFGQVNTKQFKLLKSQVNFQSNQLSISSFVGGRCTSWGCGWVEAVEVPGIKIF